MMVYIAAEIFPTCPSALSPQYTINYSDKPMKGEPSTHLVTEVEQTNCETAQHDGEMEP
jgi:hypothetical protein